MKILPIESVEYLRINATDDSRFPNPDDATDEQLRSVPYICEVYTKDGKSFETTATTAVVLTFAEIEADYYDMKANLSPDAFRECFNEEYSDVYDYIRDCIDQALHPCRILC